jgi:acyl carrier protein
MSEIRAQVRRYIEDNFLMGARGRSVADPESFLDNHILDSTGFLELITFLEEHYRIEIDNEEMVPENLDSLLNVEAFVKRKLAQGVTP